MGEVYDRKHKKRVRPEFMNRIDEIVLFNPLSRDEIHDIVRLQLKLLPKSLEQKGITLEASQE